MRSIMEYLLFVNGAGDTVVMTCAGCSTPCDKRLPSRVIHSRRPGDKHPSLTVIMTICGVEARLPEATLRSIARISHHILGARLPVFRVEVAEDSMSTPGVSLTLLRDRDGIVSSVVDSLSGSNILEATLENTILVDNPWITCG